MASAHHSEPNRFERGDNELSDHEGDGNLETELQKNWPQKAWLDVNVAVAVSGGPDSVALLHAIHKLKQRAGGRGALFVAHYNHGWRGAESDADEEFVKRLSATWGLSCVCGRPSAARGMSSEESARNLRYGFLVAAANERGARYLATGHTADDQAETVLHHLFRGTGLRGLAGMPPYRRLSESLTLIRPFLFTRRQTLLDYLRRHRLDFRQDVTNADTRFRRNWIRHELLPKIEREYRSSAADAICRLATSVQRLQADIDMAVSDLKSRALAASNMDKVVLDVQALAGQPAVFVGEFFVSLWRDQDWPRDAMTKEHWDRLVSVSFTDEPAAADELTFTLPAGVQVTRSEDRLTMQRFPVTSHCES